MVALAENSIQLVPDGTLVVHVLLIWLMVVVLNRTLFKPINRVLAEREERTQGRLSETEELVQRVNGLVHEYEGQLREARTEGYHELERTKAESLRERDQQINTVKTEVGELVAGQKTELTQHAESVRAELAAASAQVGLEIATRILGRPARRP